MGRGGPIIKGREYDFPKTVQQWPKLRLVKSTSKLRRLLRLFWKAITLQGKKIHLRNRTSCLGETGARMLLMAFQNKALKGSTLRRQPWQINTAVLVQCQKHPAHSRSAEHSQAAHKYLGCRTHHCVGKGKDRECSRQLPRVKFCCLHRCHQMPALTKTRLCYPSLHNLYCCEIPKPGISITKALDTMPGLFSLIHYPLRLHLSLKHLFFLSVSPAALLLQPNE